ncbi:Predicted Yippee-type zinc-binding protein [Plasmopara halstedii]|uniref:Predicted Yippee-type zinc-binding protein n=1 Tax=Plasmopara halstedii TaxID=4781 RepID=A0A0P1AEZ3_PLAHL|nr:Predicted Yippee-type zinc-binding protein [Plasmopara halstedii]CEG38945.1 Predicted Yippee-type zinc-binding protein [Plasmopara halstedii]|eukprot:XP_024575314.1 Predicted Yippee-type zinc-binding protein [Plasmopara halstedii]
MPALTVIRSGGKGVERIEMRGCWQPVPHLERSNGSDEMNDEELLDQAEDIWRNIGSNFEVNQNPRLSSKLSGVKGMHALLCAGCGTLVGDRDDIISKEFFGRYGKAFLMNTMLNVRICPARNRYLMTGMHCIAEVLCSRCDNVLGWKYLKAMEPSQKYKEGKFIMEYTAVDDESEEHIWNRV